MADGSVIIGVNLDTKKADKELAKLKKEIAGTEGAISEQEAKKSPLVAQAERLNREMKQARAEVQRLGQQWSDGVAGSDGQQAKAQERLHQIESEYAGVVQQLDKIDEKLLPAYEKLDRMKEEAGGLQQNIEKAAKNTKKMEKAYKKASKHMGVFATRLRGIALSAFVFNILSAGFRELTEWMGNVIKSNEKARASIAKLKGALLTLAQPLVDTVIPAFIAFVEIFASAIEIMARFVAAIFGTTIEDAAKSAEELYNEQQAIQGVGNAAKKAEKQLASFDEINRLSGDSASSNASAIAPDFSGVSITNLPGWLKNLVFDIEAKIENLRFLWDKGKLQKSKDAWIIALTGLLGAVIGGMFGGLSGSVIGLLLGLAVGLFLSSFTDKIKNPDRAKSIFITVLSAILGAVLGAMFGGLHGAIIGLLLGASIGLISCTFLDDLENPEQSKKVFTVALAAILGVVLGAMFGGLTGAVIGLLLGVSASLISIEFSKGKSSSWDSKDTIVVVLSAILGAVLGAAFGGLAGAVIGLLLGAAISFVSIKFSEGSYNKDEAISTLRIALFAILGAVLGAMFGGFVGGIIGLLVGMTIGFTTVAFDEELETSVRTAAQKALKVALTTIIGALIGAVFGGGVFGGIVGGVIGLTFGLAITLSDANITNDFSGGSSRGGSVGAGRYSIPGLATGSVIPPNREFLAVLGDNKTETEVVSPLSTMKQAFIEAMREGGMGMGNMTITIKPGPGMTRYLKYELDSEATRQGGKLVTQT